MRTYARCLVLRRWHKPGEWNATVSIVYPESHFDPCASYPGRHDCGYAGWNACGVPQADPCPRAWRGNLWRTRFRQCRWFVAYVARRYGHPLRALYVKQTTGTY